MIDYIGTLSVGGIACGLSLLTQVVNKVLINEKKADRLTKEMGEIQKELPKMDPKSKEFNEKQEKMLDMNLDRMKMQMKPMMLTFIPYIILFYFISATFAYSPIAVGSTVDMTIMGSNHIYSDCLGLDQDIADKFQKAVTIGSDNCTIKVGETETKLDLLGKNTITEISAQNLKIQVTPPPRTYIELPMSLPLVGDSLEWLGTFITFSLISSLVFTKVLRGKYLRKWED